MNINIINHEEIYNRITSGKPYDRNLKSYSEIVLERVLRYLEGEEEYEKCHILKEYMDSRFVHEVSYNSKVTLNLESLSIPIRQSL